MMEKRFITWSYIEMAVDEIAKQIIEANFDIRYIVGMPRGGLIPAVMLSHRLNVPLSTGNLKPWEHDTIHTLVVDDICDTGNTIKDYYESGCLTATIHYKKSAILTPDFYFKETTDNQWIVYPWENIDSDTIQDYLK